MGDDRTSRRRRRDETPSASSPSSSSDDSDEERRRKRRRKDKKRSKHHSKDRKHKRDKHRKRHSSSDESSDSESESERRRKRKLLKDAKRILKEAKRSEKPEKSEKPNGATTTRKISEITEDDYYVKNNEFSSWLSETRRTFFSSLTSEESRRLFTKFVDEWNAGKLQDKYYEGIKTVQRTNHKWRIVDEAQEAAEKEERWLANKKKEKLEQKKFAKEHELVMDEILPKATGKDRLFEKKAIERQKNKAREMSPEPMKESDMMGGGDDFKQMLARDRARREKRANAKAEQFHKKLSVVEERETATMDQFRALVAGGKITIPKRE